MTAERQLGHNYISLYTNNDPIKDLHSLDFMSWVHKASRQTEEFCQFFWHLTLTFCRYKPTAFGEYSTLEELKLCMGDLPYMYTF